METALSDGSAKICKGENSIRKQGLKDWEGLVKEEWETEGREQAPERMRK